MKNLLQNTQSSKRMICMVYSPLFLLILYTVTSIAQIQTNVPALKDVYKNDFYIGCLLSYNAIGFPTDPPVAGQSAVYDPNGGYLIKFHMNSMGPGNNMKPQNTVSITGSASAYAAAATQTEKDSINVHPVIKFNGDMIAQLNWAQRQGFKFRGHTLVWHSQTPGTAFFRTGYSSTTAYLTKEIMAQRLENYIKEVIRTIHEGWPGLLVAMDVVNEAMNDNGTDRSSGSEWYTTFGDNSYIMKAFEYARKYTVQYGETQLKLYYNDYNTSTASKADGIVRVCGPIFRAGYLDGIGMQEHDGISSPTAAQWIASYNKFDTICTEMAVTELDVSSNYSQLTAQANQFAMLFKCFLDRSYRSGRGKIINVTKDGLNDAHTFNVNSSIFDSTDQCKPSFYAVVDVGRNYNSLDSLITYTNSLQQKEYSASSWSIFTSALVYAKSLKNLNYSSTISAASSLGLAKDTLLTGINSLVKIGTGVRSMTGTEPTVFELGQNYPNPFNPVTTIHYDVPVTSHVSLTIYDVLGRTVAMLVHTTQSPNRYMVQFDASHLGSGVYYYRIDARNQDGSNIFNSVKKLVVIK
jgi:GH35 family endo-1,4-beta-xylanase